MPSLVFMFEVHQPRRFDRNFRFKLLRLVSEKRYDTIELESLYFDQELDKRIFDRISKKCYIPSLKIIKEEIERTLDQDKKFKISLGVSGLFIEQCNQWNTNILELIDDLVKTNCVELLSETYYHSLACILDYKEFKEQILEHKRIIQKVFNYRTTGFENTEFVYNSEIASIVRSLGFKYMLTEGCLLYTSPSPRDRTRSRMPSSA